MSNLNKFVFILAFLSIFYLSNDVSAQEESDLTSVSMEDLMNIQVYSASKKPERFFDTAAAIYVITPDDIKRSGATSIPELLRMVPGINVQRVNTHSWDISARGFNGSVFSNKLLVLIDGRAVYTPLYGGVFWDVQDVVLEDIERIEVIRGPGGTLWGANAVSGVINVITKKAKDTQGGLISVGAGSEEKAFSTLRYGGKTNTGDPDKDWYYRADAKYFDRAAGYRATGTANDEWQEGQTGFQAEKGKMTVQGDFYQGYEGQRVAETSFVPPYSSVDDTTSTVQGANLMAKYEDDDWSLQSYWDMTDRNLQVLEEHRDSFDLEYTKHVQATERQEVTWGLGYRLNLEDENGTDTLVINHATELDQVYSLFGQDEIKFLDDRLKLTFGSKLEHNIYSHFEVEPSVRLSYDLNESNAIWAAASRAVRTPSRLETDGEATLSAVNIPVFDRTVGNDQLKSEKMRSFELGYRTQPRENILLDLALYADHYDDLITYTQGNSITVDNVKVVDFPAANGLGGDIQGVELSGDIKIKDWWKVKTYYTFSKSSLSTYLGITNIGVENGLENSFPRQTAYLRSSFDLPYAFQFDTTLRYADSFEHGSVPSDTELDLNLTKTIKQWEIAVVAQNLLRSHHVESSGTGIGLTQVERGGYVKVTRRF